jgi:hypothetical protein
LNYDDLAQLILARFHRNYLNWYILTRPETFNSEAKNPLYEQDEMAEGFEHCVHLIETEAFPDRWDADPIIKNNIEKYIKNHPELYGRYRTIEDPWEQSYIDLH